MADSKCCMNCGTAGPAIFRSLKDKKWEKAENNNLIKEKWVKGENLLQKLRREAKRVRILVGEVETTPEKVNVAYKDVGTTMEDITNEDVSMVDLIGTIKAMARIFYEREHIKKEGPIYSYDELREQSNSTSTSRPAHMATIVANPCFTAPIPRNGVLNPKFIDSELIIKHLGKRFITTLGIPYHEHCQNYRGERSDNDLIEKLTLHSYNDRLVEKKNDRHIQNAILFDFVGGNLKEVKDYTKALQIVYNQESMQEYLSNHIIPIVADWPGQFFIRKAITHRLLLDNEVIPSFVTSFLPIMGPLYVSLNSRELVFKQNSLLFNNIYKGIFGKKKNLGKKPRPWRIDLILYLMRVAWLEISNIVYSKFGHTCKNIEFLYLTDLLGNLIPLVLDVYAVHHREGDWAAYEEACLRCGQIYFFDLIEEIITVPR
ncbi:hypothetical protein C2G38_2040637 [Gigaspora rosea]|uniref:Uncharacterized protein n=1 Tax=Gigaspora rosea TaxID=44941 RepID=A0A397V1R4_9GLOM|nr:hypothetical protein C2G38_2040637 [Gigaspora rosea]